MQSEILKLESTQRFTGIQIKSYEVELLNHLFDFKAMPTQSIHRYYETHVKRTRNVTTNRLAKLVKSGLLIRMDDRLPKRTIFRPINYAYRLGPRGYELLKNQGYITESQMEYWKEWGYRIGMPNPHNSAIANIFINLYELVKSSGDSFDSLVLESKRGEQHHTLNEANKKSDLKPLYPDWVYETENQILCLEMDTGSQSHSVIRSKYERYKNLATLINKPLVVIFSVGLSVEQDLEETDNRKNIKNKEGIKDKRVGYLKEALPEQTEWPEHFNLFILPTRRTAKLLYKQLIKGFSRAENIRRKKRINRWILHSISASPKGISFKSSHDEKAKTLFYEDLYDLDEVVEIRINNTVNFVGVLHMEEGAVRGFQRVRANMTRVDNWNGQKSTLIPSMPLLLVYEDQETLQNDVVYLSPKSRTIIISIEAVEAAADTKLRNYPPVLEIVSQFTRKEIRLF